MEFPASVRIRPWVGENYGNSPLLLLGDSHYGLPEYDRPSFCEELVADHAAGRFPQKIFHVVEKLISSRTLDDRVARQQFWNSVAFYNFVQRVLPSRRSPVQLYVAEARNALEAVVAVLKPSALLVLSARTWNALLTPPVHERAMKIDEEVFRWTWPTGPSTTVATYTYHPTGSFGFAVSRWRPRIRAMIEESGLSSTVPGLEPPVNRLASEDGSRN